MKLKTLILVILLFPIIGMGAKVAEIDPDEYRIRQELLIKTPLGVSMDYVIEYCTKNSLKYKHRDDLGYWDSNLNKGVGVKSIWALLYEYSNHPMMRTSITADWGFDKNGKLIDIFVWKTIDAP